jgi:hypothetical protein
VNTLIIVFATASALCELFGILTVWMNYNATALAAGALDARLKQSEDIHANNEISDNPGLAIRRTDGQLFLFEAREESQRLNHSLRRIIAPLKRNKIVGLGLAAYVAGAILGLAASLLAIAK